jgi:GNAT superfamily N-acetyltransferase
MFQIRPATPADSPHAVRVVRTVFDEYGFAWDEEGYTRDLHDLEGHYLSLGHLFWVAEWQPGRTQGPLLPGDIVGTCALELFGRHPGAIGEIATVGGVPRVAAADCSLERLYVLPEARKCGLGTALFETALRHARDRGRTVMEIWSDRKLTLAHRMYARYGAVIVGERICPGDPDEAPEFGMALSLQTKNGLREGSQAKGSASRQ